MATLTYNIKSTTALTGDIRSNAGTFSNDVKERGLWITDYFPWAELNYPWQFGGMVGSSLILDIKN